MKSPNIRYIPALDHIRFFAAFLILVYHGTLLFGGFFITHAWHSTRNPLYALFLEGHVAVALFMVLSGFIFTTGARGHRVVYFGFIRNRFLRIYPLFLFLIFSGIYLYSEDISATGLLKTIFFLSYEPGAQPVGPLSILFWSVSVECQFYFLFPLLLHILQRHGPGTILWIALSVVAARSVAAFVFGMDVHFLSFYTLFGRLDQFLIGMVSAELFAASGPRVWVRMLAPSCLLVMAMCLFLNRLGGWPANSWWRLYWPLLEGTVWAFFLMSYVSVVRGNTRPAARLLSRLGELSFSIYLIHFPVWVFLYRKKWLMDIFSEPALNALINAILLVLPVTLALSFITYHVIEKPFLRLRVPYLLPQSPTYGSPSP